MGSIRGNGRQRPGGTWTRGLEQLSISSKNPSRVERRSADGGWLRRPPLIQKGRAVSRTGVDEEARPAAPRSPAPRIRGRRSLREKSPSVFTNQNAAPARERSRAPRRERASERQRAGRDPSLRARVTHGGSERATFKKARGVSGRG